TIIRGGYGLYYGRTSNGLIFNALTQTGLRIGGGATGAPDLSRTVVGITVAPTTTGAPTFPNIYTEFPTNLNPAINVTRLDPNYKNPRLQEFNIAFERELVKNLTASASFIYTKGDRLPVNFDTNLPQPAFTRNYSIDGQTITVPYAAGVTCNVPLNTIGQCPMGQAVSINNSRLNPAFGSANLQRTIGETYYRALFVEVKKRFSDNYQFGIAYTFAKAENLSGTGDGAGGGPEGPFNGSSLFNQFDNTANRAAAPTDQRHRFVFNGIFNQPRFNFGSRIANALLNDYRLSGVYTAESGRPYSANVATAQFSFLQDGRVFSPFAGGVLGLGGLSIAPDVPRNSVYGESNFRLDLRLARAIRITERVGFELIAEGFNVFNRSNFNGFNSTLYNAQSPGVNAPIDAPIVLTRNPLFGTRTDEGSQPDGTNSRRFQLAARFRF
ncbi:MAG: hypothetical protein H7Z37_03400, partial [Pyrinomonadaceae bacterium]|nr:hypothetical protein [Pyrinomonadaceae bacterium]